MVIFFRSILNVSEYWLGRDQVEFELFGNDCNSGNITVPLMKETREMIIGKLTFHIHYGAIRIILVNLWDSQHFEQVIAICSRITVTMLFGFTFPK